MSNRIYYNYCSEELSSLVLVVITCDEHCTYRICVLVLIEPTFCIVVSFDILFKTASINELRRFFTSPNPSVPFFFIFSPITWVSIVLIWLKCSLVTGVALLVAPSSYMIFVRNSSKSHSASKSMGVHVDTSSDSWLLGGSETSSIGASTRVPSILPQFGYVRATPWL